MYSPSGDYIRMPPRSCFVGLDEYYETLFHELVHWSEHPSRLEQSCKDTANTYIMGELVAQIRACYLALELGVSFSPSADRRSSNRQWSSRLCSPPNRGLELTQGGWRDRTADLPGQTAEQATASHIVRTTYESPRASSTAVEAPPPPWASGSSTSSRASRSGAAPPRASGKPLLDHHARRRRATGAG